MAIADHYSRLADPRTNQELLHALRRERIGLRALISRFNVQSYEFYRNIELLEMELNRRDWELQASLAWLTGRPTLAPPLDPPQRPHVSARVTAPGRMPIDEGQEG